MTITQTPHGELDLTEVALDLTDLIDSIPKVDEGLSHPEYVRQIAAHDAALVAKAREQHPQFEWHLVEPDRGTVLIDNEGIFWTFTDNDPDNDFSDPEWTPHCYTVTHKLLCGPSLCNEWADVLSYGPVRTYVPEIDGRPIWRFRYRPGGASADADPTTYLCNAMPQAAL
jgi:hypothetical protein